MRIGLRTIEPGDLHTLAVLNDAAVPAVNELGTTGLRDLLPHCDLALVAVELDTAGEPPLGFLLGMAGGSDYDSENYRWFVEHRPDTFYVDRIVVAPRARGRGVGAALHEAVAAHAARAGFAAVGCEVNLDPPNPRSIEFHTRIGFTRVDEQATKNGTVRVALMVREL